MVEFARIPFTVLEQEFGFGPPLPAGGVGVYRCTRESARPLNEWDDYATASPRSPSSCAGCSTSRVAG